MWVWRLEYAQCKVLYDASDIFLVIRLNVAGDLSWLGHLVFLGCNLKVRFYVQIVEMYNFVRKTSSEKKISLLQLNGNNPPFQDGGNYLLVLLTPLGL